MTQTVFHRARWICPVNRPPIEGGMVAVTGSTITGAGTKNDLKEADGSSVVDHGDVAILPAFTNAHTHLELSLLENRTTTGGSFVDWLRSLLCERDKLNHKDFNHAIACGLDICRKNGTGLIADISNTGRSADHLNKTLTKSVLFLEAIGLDPEKLPVCLAEFHALYDRLKIKHPFTGVAAHSPYTVSPELFSEIHALSAKGFPILSVHVAESDNESEFLAGKGPLYDLMRERNFRDGDWTPPMKSPVQYMDMLGLLTRDTLCVHLVQVSDSDIELLSQRRPRICLCPRSNQKLRVGTPPVEKLFRKGLPIALGTDSLASNDDLSILKEMARIREIAPVVSPDEIIRMGTINGATALNMEKQLGSIEEGKEASLISLSVTSSSSGTLYDEIVCDGYRKEIKWINQPQ